MFLSPQIMPIAPTQVLRPSEYDMYQIFDITLKNRTSCQNNNIPGLHFLERLFSFSPIEI